MSRTRQKNYYFTQQQIGIDNRCRDADAHTRLRHAAPAMSWNWASWMGMDGPIPALGCRITVVEGAKKTRNMAARSMPAVMMSRWSIQHSSDPTRGISSTASSWEHAQTPGRSGRVAHTIASTAESRPTIDRDRLRRRDHYTVGSASTWGFCRTSVAEQTDKRVGNVRHYDLEFPFRAPSRSAASPRRSQLDDQAGRGDRMEDWPDALLDALDKIATEIPDYGWYIDASSR